MRGDARLELVDALRGFALMGLFLVHCIEFYEVFWGLPNAKPGAVHEWVFALFGSKSYALLALCFGLSFFIIMDRAARRGQDFTGRFIWRLAILFGIGIGHSLVYRGDILQIIPPLGLALLLFDRIGSNRVLLLIAGLCFLQVPLFVRMVAALDGAAWANHSPYFLVPGGMDAFMHGSLRDVLAANLVEGRTVTWSYYIETGRIMQMLGLFLVGLVLGRIGFFAAPERFRLVRRAVLACAAVVFAALFFGEAPAVAAMEATGVNMAKESVAWLLGCWKALALLTIQVVLFIELYQFAAERVLRLLAPVGRMTLTLYVGQSLLFVPVFYNFGLGLYDDITQAQALCMGLVAFTAQVIFAHWWFRNFHYGPLEWVWRALTYRSLDVPFVRKQATMAVAE